MFSFKEKRESISQLGYSLALKLIYEWVKTGVIGQKQFATLIEDVVKRENSKY